MEDGTTTPHGSVGEFSVVGDSPPALRGRPCPPTPWRGRSIQRQDSLRDTKLLVSTDSLRRVAGTSDAVLASASREFAFEDELEFLRVIGRSPTSEVWLARSRDDGALSAVKRSLAEFTGRADRSRLLREVQAAAALPEHPHVVRYLRGWQQERHFFAQMELCEGGSLAAVLQALPAGVRLPEGDLWRLAAELGDALQHCHRHGVLHLDVKPANVFLDGQAAAKLGDFGLAVLPGQRWVGEEGDGAYVAPELLCSGQPTPACDLYSFGATLAEAASGAPPPRADAAASLRVPELLSAPFVQLLRAMLHPEPRRRPSALQVRDEARRVVAILHGR